MKLDESRIDFEKRVQGMSIESDINKMIFKNSKTWLFESLLSMTKELLMLFSNWKENAQKNVDSSNIIQIEKI